MSRIGSGLLAEAGRLHALGVEHNNAGHPLRAIRLFRQALALPELARPAGEPARLTAARIWISLAMSESEVFNADRGLADLAEAERLVELTGNPGLSALLHLQYGYIQVRAGHFDEGLAHLDAAVELIEHAEPAHACNILLNRGSLQLYRGQLAAARQDLIRSADLAARHGLRVEEFKARHNLGYLEFLAGNLALALKTMDDAQAIDAEVSLAVWLLDRARVLLEAGLYRESDDALIEAAALFRADRLHKELAEVELARAECALLDGEIAAARRLAATARDRFRRRANDRWRRDAQLVLLHADLAAGRPGGGLVGPALRLAAEFRREGLGTQARTSQLIAAEALLRAGRAEQARQVAGEAGPVRAADPVSARLHTRLVRARLSIAAGDGSTARREVRTGLAELAHHQAQFGSIDLQTASAVHGRQLAELDLSMALAEGEAGRGAGRGRARPGHLEPAAADQRAVGPGGGRPAGRAAAHGRGAALDLLRRRRCRAGQRPAPPGRRPAAAAAGPVLAGGRVRQRAPAGVARPDRGRAGPHRDGAGLLLRRRRPAARRGAGRWPVADRAAGQQHGGVGDGPPGARRPRRAGPPPAAGGAARLGVRDPEPVAGRAWPASCWTRCGCPMTGW